MGHYAHQSSGGHSPLAAMYFYKPGQPHLKDATDEIWRQSAQWIQRRYRLKVLTPDNRQQRTTAYPISSPGTFDTGELKNTKPVTANMVMVNISIKSQAKKHKT